MKIAIPIESAKENARLSQVFARSKCFAIYDTSTHTYTYLDNQYCDDKWQVADNVSWMLSREDVKQYIGFDFGLKMQNQAETKGIQLVLIQQNLRTLKDILEKLKNSKS